MSKYLCILSLLLTVAIVNAFQNRLVSSKTRYRDLNSGDLELPPGTDPSKAFMLLRNGISLLRDKPSNFELVKSYQQTIKENLKNNKVEKDEFLQAFAEWSMPDIDPNKDPFLLESGKNEIKDLAHRLKSKLQGLFSHKYDAAKYPILAIPDKTSDKRSTLSAQVFLEAVFDTPFPHETIPTCHKEDLLLMNEHARTQDPKKDDFKVKNQKNVDDLKASPEFDGLRERFANKFQIDSDKVDYDTVKAFFEVCRSLRISTDSDNIVVCDALSEEDAAVLLRADENYWALFTASDNIYNAQMACGMIEHIASFLKRDTPTPFFPMYCAHRSNNLVVTKALGLHPKENFDSSYYTAFNTNLLILVFPKPDGEDDLVGIYVNETLTAIPLADGTLCDKFCPSSKVLEVLEQFLLNYKCEEVASGVHGYSYSHPKWLE